MNKKAIENWQKHYSDKSDDELIIAMHQFIPSSEMHIAAKLELEHRKQQSELKKKKNEDNILINTAIWADITEEFGITKKSFGKKINFIKDRFCRKVIFRDLEQAYILAKKGFSKPSVILAGAVIEEFLRQYLIYKKVTPDKDTFDAYIKACQDNSILKSAIHNLSNSVRYFRNIVHIEKEKDSKYTISKATAKGAVASIFTIANDF
ncbi:MAG: hypothetical protein KJ893_05945 [Candidatus Omnitrophica bacterium]|nr:hypothetical protein [Candidatus Omnitrophota bacterium]MBU4479583.1 hypothetical protein [Candidatus Omnitrophota bacterium]MCG2703717.1 hypothetical protein [Candidatus Omnitrophota bacterium]